MAMKVRLLLSSIVASMMLLASCGHYVCGTTFGSSSCSAGGGGISSGGGGTGAGDAFLYIADAGGVQGLTLNASAGTIVDLPNPILGIPQGATNYWTVIAQKQYMYIGYPSLGEIYGYTISSTGALTGITGSPFPAGYLSGAIGGSKAMITNPAGTQLFVLSPSTDAVYEYSIGTGGGLTLVGSPLALSFEPFNLAIDGLGKYLYVSNTTGAATTEIAAYNIGTLAAVPGSPFVSSGGNLNYALSQMQGDPSGAYLIGTTSSITGSDANLYVLAITQSSGAITPVTNSPFATKFSPANVTVQPSPGGTLVYSLSLTSADIGNVVEGYQLNLSTGALSAITGSPFAALGGFAQFDQSGTFLFVVEDPNLPQTLLDVYDVSGGGALLTPTATVGWAQGSWAPTDIP
jgi:6-phosphogluconolactonase